MAIDNTNNMLRSIIDKAEDENILSKSEIGFIIQLVEKFRADIEKKVRLSQIIQGEISQLKANEKIIIDLISNIIAAAERDEARQETMDAIRSERSENKVSKDN